MWLAERGGAPTAPLFPTSSGKPLTRKALARRIAKHSGHATERCPSLIAKTITPHVLRHGRYRPSDALLEFLDRL